MKSNEKIEGLRNKIEENHLELIQKINRLEIKLTSMDTKLIGIPCIEHNERLNKLETRLYMAVGGLSLILITKQLGLW